MRSIQSMFGIRWFLRLKIIRSKPVISKTCFDSFNANAKRNAAAEDDFANVFSDVNLGDTRLGSSTNERAKALNDIVLMINEFNFKDDSGHDIFR